MASTCGSHRRRGHQAVRLMPFYPGPGRAGIASPSILLSFVEDQAGRYRGALHRTFGGIHQRQMPQFVADKVQNALNDAGKPVKGSRIPCHGRGVQAGHLRTARIAALDVMLLLKRRGGRSELQRSSRPRDRVDGIDLESAPQESAAARLRGDRHAHSAFRLQVLVRRAWPGGGHAQCVEGHQFRTRSFGCERARHRSPLRGPGVGAGHARPTPCLEDTTDPVDKRLYNRSSYR